MEKSRTYPLYKCAEHDKAIEVIFPNNLAEKNILCKSCLTDQLVGCSVPIPQYVNNLAKFQEEFARLSSKQKKPPKSLNKVLELEDSALKNLMNHFEAQKGHIDYIFDKLLSEIKNIFKLEKEKLLKEIDNQVAILQHNFEYFNLKLMKYGSSEPTEPITWQDAEAAIYQEFDQIGSGEQFHEWVKSTIDDVEDLSIFNRYKNDDNKIKGIYHSLKFLGQQIEKQTTIRPTCQYDDDMIAKIRDSITNIFKDRSGLVNKIIPLTLSAYFYETKILKTPKEFEQLRSIIQEDNVPLLIQRIYSSNPEDQLKHIYSAMKYAAPLLFLIKTTEDVKFGFYTDRSLNPVGGYMGLWKDSTKSFIFSLEDKAIARVRSEKKSLAVFCPKNQEYGIQLGDGPDLLIQDNGPKGLKGVLKMGSTYAPQWTTKEEAESIIEKFAGGKSKWNFLVEALEIFSILNHPESTK